MATTSLLAPDWKMPGYTGYVVGLAEVYGKTPIMAQSAAKEPSADSFLFTRTQTAPVTTPVRDPCNFPETYKPRKEPVNLWPAMQTVGKQPSAKPPTSHLALGDDRIDPFVTSYKAQYDAPFEDGRRIRSPLRNKNLQDVVDLKDVYRSAFQRVGEKRLNHMIVHMKERLAGKIGNANNNAFKLRKLFKMYDTTGSGLIEIEDFRVMTESFGMQLDDDSLLALFSRYDPEANGVIDYPALMEGLLDSDYYALYVGATDNTRGTHEAANARALSAALHSRLAAVAPQLRQVLSALDSEQTGCVDMRTLAQAAAACNLLLDPREQAAIADALDPAGSGAIPVDALLDTFCTC